jgi:hypothetical protein
MEGWTTTTYQLGSVTVIVHRPILTNEERAKREQEIVNTLANLTYFKKGSKDETH